MEVSASQLGRACSVLPTMSSGMYAIFTGIAIAQLSICLSMAPVVTVASHANSINGTAAAGNASAEEELVVSKDAVGFTGPCTNETCQAHCRGHKHTTGQCEAEQCLCKDSRARCLFFCDAGTFFLLNNKNVNTNMNMNMNNILVHPQSGGPKPNQSDAPPSNGTTIRLQ